MDDLDLPRDSPERFASVPTEQLLNEALSCIAAVTDESEEYWLRVRQLYRRGGRDIFDVAMAWLDSPIPAERQTGADVLAQLGNTDGNAPFADESVDRLVPLLIGETAASVLMAAASAIAFLMPRPHRDTIGHDGISRLIELSQHSDPDVRHGVAHAFSSQTYAVATDPECRRCVAALAAMSVDTDRDVRDWVSFYLAQVATIVMPADEGVVAALWKMAVEEDQEIRVQAIWGLAEAGDREILSHLIREIDFQADGEDPVFWTDTFDAVEVLPDASLTPHLLRLRLTMIEDEVDDRWMRMIDEAIAACTALPE